MGPFDLLERMLADRHIGSVVFHVTALLFLYYTIWVFALPFVEEDHAFRNYFPDVYYATAIPLMTMMTFLCLATGTIGYYMIQYNNNSKSLKTAKRKPT